VQCVARVRLVKMGGSNVIVRTLAGDPHTSHRSVLRLSQCILTVHR
jgi:hypothetical protein